jgi:hypothetical protein
LGDRNDELELAKEASMTILTLPAPTRDSLLSQVRLYALVRSFYLTYCEDWGVMVEVGGNADVGSFFETRGGEGDYLVCWNRKGAVLVEFTKYEDFDGQGQLEADERTPERYLRSPEATAVGGVAAPPELDALVTKALNDPRMNRLLSGALWFTRDRSSFEHYGPRDCESFRGLLLSPEVALLGGADWFERPWEGWALAHGLRPAEIALVQRVSARPWTERTTLTEDEERALLSPEGAGGARGTDPKKLARTAAYLRRLGVEWSPRRLTRNG